MKRLIKSISLIVLYAYFIHIIFSFQIRASEKDVLITDYERCPIPDATISILSRNDSTTIYAATTDSKGHINIPDTLNSDDLIFINHPGYNMKSISLADIKDTLKIHKQVKDLQEVVVLGNKDQIRAEAGKIIFTPGDLKTKVNTAFDLIRYVPLVSLENDVFKILDKASYILVNGMDPQVPQQQIIAELRSASPSIIKSIEIRPNPGSEYSASNNIGIININLVDFSTGFWATASFFGSAGDNNLYQKSGVNIFYSNKRFRMSAYGSFLSSKYSRKEDNFYTYDLSGTSEEILNINNKFFTDQRYYNIGSYLFMSYDLTKNSKIGGGVSLYTLKHNDRYNTTSLYSSTKGDTEKNTISQYIQPWTKPNLDYRIYYLLNSDSKGSRLEISGLYNHGSSIANSYYDFDPEKDEYQKTLNNGGSANIKYTHVFNVNQVLKGGYGFNTTHRTDMSETSIQKYSFDYKELIHSAYIELQSIWGKGLSSSLGLRMEADRINGSISNGSLLYNRKGIDLFPSLSINYSIPSGNHDIMFELTRRIFRPQFSDLNPYILWTSDNTCIAGNPELKSDKYWNTSLMYLFLQNYILRVAYTYDEDPNMMFRYGENGISFDTRINRSHSHSFYYMFEMNKDLLKSWRFRISTEISYTYSPLIFEGKDLTEKAWSAILNIRNHFSFPCKYIPYIDFNIQTGYSQQFLGRGDNFTLNTNLSFSKEIIKNLNVDLKLQWSPSIRFKVKTIMPDYYKEIRNLNIPLTAYLNVVYTFGKRQLRRYIDEGDRSYKDRF